MTNENIGALIILVALLCLFAKLYLEVNDRAGFKFIIKIKTKANKPKMGVNKPITKKHEGKPH